MHYVIERLSNTGTGVPFWFNVGVLLVTALLMIYGIYQIIKVGKLVSNSQPVGKLKIIALVMKIAAISVVMFAMFSGYGHGTHTREISPERHSLNKDIMQAGDVWTDKQIDSASDVNTDIHLKQVQNPAATLDSVAAESQAEIDKILERWN